MLSIYIWLKALRQQHKECSCCCCKPLSQFVRVKISKSFSFFCAGLPRESYSINWCECRQRQRGEIEKEEGTPGRAKGDKHCLWSLLCKVPFLISSQLTRISVKVPGYVQIVLFGFSARTCSFLIVFFSPLQLLIFHKGSCTGDASWPRWEDVKALQRSQRGGSQAGHWPCFRLNAIIINPAASNRIE